MRCSGDDVAGEDLLDLLRVRRCWIVNRIRSGKIALKHRLRWNQETGRKRLAYLQKLEVSNSEKLVLNDGSADRAPN